MAFTARAENVSPLAALKNVLQDALAVARVGRRTMHYLIRGKREPGSVARQMFAIGNQSLFFMCITMAFIGAIITFSYLWSRLSSASSASPVAASRTAHRP